MSAERLAEILKQILARLDTDREAQQSIVDAEPHPLLAGEARVGGGRRAREERLHTPEARRDRGNTHAMREVLGAALAALELEAQHATVAGGLNVVSLWSSYSRVPDCHDRVPAMCDDEDGLVVKLYQSWPKELLYFERNKLETSHDDLPPHTHSHIKLIARRPG